MPKIFPGLSKTFTRSALKILRIKKFDNRTYKQFNYELLSVSRRFFAKNLLVFLVFFTLPVISLSGPLYFITQDNMKDEVNKNNENMLEQIKDSMEMMIDDTESLNLVYSTNPEMIRMMKRVLNNETKDSSYIHNSSVLKSFLVSLVASKPYIYSIYIYTENQFGNFLSSTDGVVTLDQYFDRSWFDSYRDHNADRRAFWMESRSIKRYSFENETDVITIYKEFFTKDGIIALNISKSYLTNRIDDLNLLEDQAIFVLNENNDIILKNKNGNAIPDSQLEPLLSSGEQISTIGNTKYHISRIDSEKYRWKFISVTPMTTLYESSIQMRNLMAISFVLSIILCIGFALITTQRTTRLVSTIVNVLDQAERGQQPVSPLPKSYLKNEFDVIIQNILKAYLEQNALKMQLTENQYKMEILQLTALQSQMNPHFLFNTLKTIFWMSFKMTNSMNEVSRMVENLSNILHYSMDNRTHLVSLCEEIATTQDYVTIEKTRFQDQFDVIWEYPEHIGKYFTLKLLIQPLVENAIHHGLRQSKDKGYVKIKIIERQDCILLYVTDNGIGMEREKVEALNRELRLRQEKIDHIGLYNCNRRLFLAFGDAYGISIKSKLGLGTSVAIRLPKIRSKNELIHDSNVKN